MSPLLAVVGLLFVTIYYWWAPIRQIAVNIVQDPGSCTSKLIGAANATANITANATGNTAPNVTANDNDKAGVGGLSTIPQLHTANCSARASKFTAALFQLWWVELHPWIHTTQTWTADMLETAHAAGNASAAAFGVWIQNQLAQLT